MNALNECLNLLAEVLEAAVLGVVAIFVYLTFLLVLLSIPALMVLNLLEFWKLVLK